tara:strand:+ start:147280 stop:149022 length:1743 start_codon:yes stop_codon:yes gene_type:complete
LNTSIYIPSILTLDAIKNVWKVGLCIGFGLLFVFISVPNAGANNDSSTKFSPKVDVEKFVDQMSLEEKVGQLFILGFQGQSFNPQIHEKIKKIKPGAFIFFGRNVKKLRQTHKLTENIRSHSSLYPFQMIDQEGGVVSRIKSFPPPPSALAMGQAKNLMYVKTVSKLTSNILTDLGFNFNLAPVADLSNPYEKNFMGNRSFGDNPAAVASMLTEFAMEHEKNSVIATFKHFPGHGGIAGDSHKMTPINKKSKEELYKHDMSPFQHVAQFDFPTAIMTAHVSYPALDPSGLPATFSEPILKGILRNEFKYKGLIISDDLEMYGAEVKGDIGDRAIKALNAGVDMVMVAWSHNRQMKAYRKVLNAVRQGDIELSRLNQKVLRILKTKQRVWYPPVKHNPIEAVKHSLARLKDIGSKIIEANFNSSPKLVGKSIEHISQAKKVYFYTSSWSLYQNLKDQVGTKLKYIPLKPGQKVNFSVLKSRDQVGLFYVSGHGTARILQRMPSRLRNKILVVNGTYPGIIQNASEYAGVLHLNSQHNQLGQWIKNAVDEIHKRKKRLRQPASEVTSHHKKRSKKKRSHNPI